MKDIPQALEVKVLKCSLSAPNEPCCEMHICKPVNEKPETFKFIIFIVNKNVKLEQIN